jgi:transcriptional regulator with PAS, ATPase and Fis domain
MAFQSIRRALDGRVGIGPARLLERLLAPPDLRLEDRINEVDALETFETESSIQRAFLIKALRAAATDSVVLLRGESGTGKNVLARWMRARSKRADRPS